MLCWKIQTTTQEVIGYAKKQRVTIFHGGETPLHSFIDLKVVTRLDCMQEPINEMGFFVANGSQLLSKAKCEKFKWKVNKEEFEAELRALPCKKCDVFLGNQWLQQFRLIKDDFQQSNIAFKHKVCIQWQNFPCVMGK